MQLRNTAAHRRPLRPRTGRHRRCARPAGVQGGGSHRTSCAQCRCTAPTRSSFEFRFATSRSCAFAYFFRLCTCAQAARRLTRPASAPRWRGRAAPGTPGRPATRRACPPAAQHSRGQVDLACTLCCRRKCSASCRPAHAPTWQAPCRSSAGCGLTLSFDQSMPAYGLPSCTARRVLSEAGPGTTLRHRCGVPAGQAPGLSAPKTTPFRTGSRTGRAVSGAAFSCYHGS